MSSALVKKSLELFEDDFKDSTTTQSKKEKLKKNLSISKKHIRKKESQQARKRKIKKTSLIDECRKKQSQDNTEESLYLLERIASTSKPQPKTVELILEHHKGKLAKNIKIEEKKPEERTVFTDKDFDKFEEEYDFFS